MKAACRFIAPFGLAVVVLAGCPNPITDDTFRQMSDRATPIVEIASPVENSPYTQTVTVTGTALDPDGSVRTVTWSVTSAFGELAAGTIDGSSLAAGGGFQFSFGTLSFSGPISVTVRASDWNDNTAVASRTLASPGASLSSFTVAPGNSRVTLDWAPVAGATYTVFYTTNGSLPGDGYGTAAPVASPPAVLDGLSNGALCVFLLRAAVAGGPTYWSDYVSAIPLSSSTLSPRVSGEYGRVRVQWPLLSAAVSYEVLRAPNRAGPFTNISGAIPGSVFVDTSVTPGATYYYAIRPAVEGGLASGPAAGSPSPFPTGQQARIGSVVVPGQAMDVAVNGSFAYTPTWSGGFKVLDVSVPGHPVVVGGLPLSGNGLSVAVAGTTVYVGTTSGFYVVDVTAPASPSLVGSLATGSVQEIAVSGGFAYLAAGASGVKKIDLAVPSSPAEVDSVPTTGSAYGIALAGGYAYVAAEGDMVIFDTATLSLQGTLTAPVRAMDVAVDGTWAYVADEMAGLRIVDVSTVGTPTEVSLLALPSLQPRGVVVDFPLVAVSGYIGVGGAALQVVNAADRVNPLISASATLPTHSESLALQGGLAYVTSYGIQVVDIANPSAPVSGGSSALSQGYDLALEGDRAVVASFGSGLTLLDVSDPDAPMQLDSTSLGSSAYGVAVRWPYAYLSEFNRFEVVSLADESNIVVEGGTTLLGYGSDVAVAGDHAFVADGPLGMTVLDVSDAANPVPVASWLTATGTSAIAVADGIVYLARGPSAGAFEILDVSDPTAPALLGTVMLPVAVDAMAISGARAWLASRSNQGLQVVDVSDPSSPVLLSVAPLGFNGRSVAVQGDYLVVGDADAEVLRVYSVRTPAAPQLVGSFVSWATALEMAGSHAFVAAFFGSGFRTLSLW
jgi:hypothetical protein